MTSIVVDMGVSKNRGIYPQNHPFVHRVFPYYKPSILGVKSPYFWFNTHMIYLPPSTSNMQGPQTGQERLSKESDKLSSPPVDVATATIFFGAGQAQTKITPPKTNGWTPKIGGLVCKCFSFSFRGYFQVPAVCFQGCKEGSQLRLPETNSKFAPENAWLKDESTLLGFGLFFRVFCC